MCVCVCNIIVVPENLYRFGNANSPKLDNVRPGKDVDVVGDTVIANGKGMSLLNIYDPNRDFVWRLNKGTKLPELLELIKDTDHHYLLAPTENMSMEEYRNLLLEVAATMNQVNLIANIL